MKDEIKKIDFIIEIAEKDFVISSSFLGESKMSQREKTLLLIALHELKESILNDKILKKIGNL
jgi:hypothetical protein